MNGAEVSVFDMPLARLALAAALGLFLGLERELSEKTAGIRTFTLVSLAAAVFMLLDQPLLLAVGGLLVVVISAVLGLHGLFGDADTLSLTTSVSLLVAYGVGALVAAGAIFEGVAVAIVSSLLLVLKQELHYIAGSLTRMEVRSAAEFAILAFVLYPLLPPTPQTVGYGALTVTIEPRLVWLIIVFVAGMGIVNYIFVRFYGGRAILVTGFFGGLASSTGVVGAMLDHVNQRPEATKYGVAAVLLSNASMAFRNLAIAVVFTIGVGMLSQTIIPLLALLIGSILVAVFVTDWTAEMDIDLDSPFSLRYAFGVGTLFLAVLLAGGFAEAAFGTAGLYGAALISGLISSAGATASAVVLYSNGDITGNEATVAILLASMSSVLVKAGITIVSPNKEFSRGVILWSLGLLVGVGFISGLFLLL